MRDLEPALKGCFVAYQNHPAVAGILVELCGDEFGVEI